MRTPVVLAVLAGALAAPGTATAGVTIGAPDVSVATGQIGGCGASACMQYQVTAPTTPSGHQWTSPIDGIVVRWRVRNTGSDGTGRLRVLRPVSSDLKVAASSASIQLPANSTTVVDAHVAIAAGDLLGLDLTQGPGVGVVTTTGGSYKQRFPPPADGVTFTPGSPIDNKELLFNADVELDADRDAFGDETQDACPTDPTSHSLPCHFFRVGAPDLTVASNSGVLCPVGSACLWYQKTAPPGTGHEWISPVNGVIVRWGARFAGPGSGAVRLRVLREEIMNSLFAEASDEPRTVGPSALPQIFDARVPVRAGDLIALDLPEGSNAGSLALNIVSATGGVIEQRIPPPPDGAGFMKGSGAANLELLMSADVEPDADGDGYGDTTQDECPTNPGPSACGPVVTIGAPNLGAFTPASSGCGAMGTGPCMRWVDPAPADRHWGSPIDGVIVRWRARTVFAENGMRLRALRPAPPAGPTLAASTAFESTSGAGTFTFPARLPVKSGDLIGIELPDNGSGGGLVVGTPQGGTMKRLAPSPPDGTTDVQPSAQNSNQEPYFNADVEPDADSDGFGDVSQDACPGAPGPEGGCVVVPAEGGGTPPVGEPPPPTLLPDLEGPAVGIARRTVTMTRKGDVVVSLSCPTTELAGCLDGLLTLETASKVNVKAAARRRVTLGRKAFSIGQGLTRKVKVHLSRKNRRLVTRLRRVSVRARARASDGLRNVHTSTATFKLKAPRKRR